MWKEFKEFAVRGNVVDLAIGIMIGGAFAPIAKSLVDDVIMPPVGLLFGKVDFKNLFLQLGEGHPPGPYATVEAAKAAGAVTLNYGQFLNTILAFLIIVFAAFLIVRLVTRLRRKEEGAPPSEPSTKKCPYCLTDLPIKATRCSGCTSALPEGTAAA
jgi:large conductance mechanosensitive channel